MLQQQKAEAVTDWQWQHLKNTRWISPYLQHSKHWCIWGHMCQILVSKGQSSRSWWNKMCWKHHFEGEGIQYL